MEGQQKAIVQRRVQTISEHFSNTEHPISVQPTAAEGTTGLLQGKVAIITGSGQGLGGAAARLFALEGACVVVSDIDATKSDEVASEIRSSGGRAISIPGDVTDPEFPGRIVSGTVSEFGAIHILVNNAGFTWDAVIHRMSDKQWQTMLDVHCTAPFRLIQAATPYMRDAAKEEMKLTGQAVGRCILNVSSTSGVHGNAGQANYSTAKMGVVGLTKSVAKEWGAFNIRCNALVYGGISTRLLASKESGNTMEFKGEKVQLGIPGKSSSASPLVPTPLGRAGTPAEAAGAMLMLASPHAAYITGQAIEVTGGAYL